MTPPAFSSWLLVGLLGAAVGTFGCSSPQTPQPADWETSTESWSVYRGSWAGNSYSPLTQVNRDNVDQLEVAWIYRTGDADEGTGSSIETNPLLKDGMLYVVSPQASVRALNPATGEEFWRFSPEESGTVRGLSYWESEDGSDRRIFLPVQELLYALDAGDGSVIESFGDEGRIDVRYGLDDRDPDSITVTMSSPGAVFEDLIILGSSTGEDYRAAPGHIRAYDVRTGERRWVFRTIPHPGEFGYETWPPEAYRTVGGANSWGGFTLDPERGIVFSGTAAPTFEFYGGFREGKNLFGNSILALDARTGERVWHFQTVHHDVWDYDLPIPPTLVNVVHEGEPVDAVAQVTKFGFVFLLNRDTGEPLFPIEERPVPASDVPGERLWPTQPFPTRPAPYVDQDLTEEDLTNVSPAAHQYALDRFRELCAGPIYTPPTLEGTLFSPGTRGGAEWNGASFDPETGVLYVNAHELPSILQLIPRPQLDEDASRAEVGRSVFQGNGCVGCHGDDLTGRESAPSLLNLSDRLSREQVEEVISSGRGLIDRKSVV